MCKITKSAEYFYKSSSAKDGLACRCKECELTYGRSRKEEKKASNGRWFTKNGDAYKQKLRDQSKAKRLKKYEHILSEASEMGIEQWRLHRAKRMVFKTQATPTWVDLGHHSRINQIYAITQQLQELTGNIYHVDHIVPLISDVVCGLHVWWNLQPMPEKSNVLKNNFFEPSLYPEQGEAAFPLGNGPIAARNAAYAQLYGRRR